MSATCREPGRADRPRHPRTSGAGRDDGGLTLVELAVTIAILGVVMAMVVPMVITFNRLTMAAQWRSDTNTSLRVVVDDVFAELRSARSLPTCAGGTGAIPVQTAVVNGTATCLRPVDNGAPVLSVATSTQLCFISQRRSLALGTGATTVLTAPAYTCVQVAGANNDQFQVVAYPPSSSGYALGTTPTSGTPASTRTLGTIQRNATPFSYYLADGATPTATLSQIAVVAFSAQLSRFDGVKTDTQTFSYRVALRPQTYRQGG
jgi:prepilin-type N-terminal cleavage/methylation domain-containing protein